MQARGAGGLRVRPAEQQAHWPRIEPSQHTDVDQPHEDAAPQYLGPDTRGAPRCRARTLTAEIS